MCFLKIDTDQARIDPRGSRSWRGHRSPPPRSLAQAAVLALAGQFWSGVGVLKEPSRASSRRGLRRVPLRTLHDARCRRGPAASVSSSRSQQSGHGRVSAKPRLGVRVARRNDVRVRRRCQAQSSGRGGGGCGPGTRCSSTATLQIVHVFIDGDEVRARDWSRGRPRRCDV